ncbi:hypothetical protein BDZ94DRAFT_1270833 [Collybia nuda]|uniref:Methyltransferase domain-containing protein n=1 Tax=Collybia nuda TaxID=64659 RepID=A0A9P5XZ71_9AGAR|nr:hypothetical protein BDZ94DRAFT_1270833 [Collybia nuda]
MNSPMASNPTQNLYVFKDRESENLRLDRQYLVLQKSFDRGPTTLSESLQDGRVNKVLDVAAGSLAWIMDVARSVEPSKVQLYACDITPKHFPAKSVMDAFSITTFIHNATQPFPQEMKAQFDIVNMRLMAFSIMEDQWEIVLKNLYDILRPGGHLYLFDTDTTFYSGKEKDSNELRVDPWLSPINSMLLKFVQTAGYAPNLTRRFPDMLRANSFIIEEQLTCYIPFGIARKTNQSLKGASLEGDEVFTGETSKALIDSVLLHALDGGYLDDGYGRPVTTEAGRFQLLEKYKKDYDNNGIILQGTQIRAIRA